MGLLLLELQSVVLAYFKAQICYARHPELMRVHSLR